jgi:hypothetical protein
MADSTATCIDIILAIILPPLGVFFKFGCGVSRRYLQFLHWDYFDLSMQHVSSSCHYV